MPPRAKVVVVHGPAIKATPCITIHTNTDMSSYQFVSERDNDAARGITAQWISPSHSTHTDTHVQRRKRQSTEV